MCLPIYVISLAFLSWCILYVLFIQCFNMRKGGFIYCFGVLVPPVAELAFSFLILGCFDFLKFFLYF